MSLALREGAHRRSCGARAREGGRGAEKAADPPDTGRVCDRPTCPPASRSRTSSSRRQGSRLLPSQLREPQLVLRHAKTRLCWMLAPGTGRLRPGLPRSSGNRTPSRCTHEPAACAGISGTRRSVSQSTGPYAAKEGPDSPWPKEVRPPKGPQEPADSRPGSVGAGGRAGRRRLFSRPCGAAGRNRTRPSSLNSSQETVSRGRKVSSAILKPPREGAAHCVLRARLPEEPERRRLGPAPCRRVSRPSDAGWVRKTRQETALRAGTWF